MNEELLTRLVNTLEGIYSNLLDISVSLYKIEKNIDGCISIGQTGQRLSITGDISVD